MLVHIGGVGDGGGLGGARTRRNRGRDGDRERSRRREAGRLPTRSIERVNFHLDEISGYLSDTT